MGPSIKPMPVCGVDPWPHQVQAYGEAVRELTEGGGGYGLLFSMGTGKTLTAVGIAGRLHEDFGVDRVLVMAPSSVLPEWRKALDRYAAFDYAVTECTGTAAQRHRKFAEALTESADGACSFAVVNYESAWRTEDAVLKFAPQLVICDESQRIKSHTAKQSKFAHKVGKRARYRLILSGTPLQNSPLDFFSQYLFLNPEVFGTRWAGFKARYAVEQAGFNHATNRQYKSVVGYRNLDELTQKVHSVALRVENGVIDLPKELPPVIRYADMGRAQRLVYDQLREESVAELGEDRYVAVPNALSKLLRLQQITSGFTVDDEGDVCQLEDAKAALFAEVVDDVVVEQGERMVVFFRFLHDMESIRSVLRKKGASFVELYGGSTQDERRRAVETFSNGGAQVFVGQLQASGTGIDGLQNVCHTAVFYSNSFNSADYEQAKARINRSGQTKSCVFMHLVCTGTVDEKILEALAQKRNMADTIVNRGAREVFG